MAEPPLNKSLRSVSLLSLPPEPCEIVWQHLKSTSRLSLIRASKATQALFSPAVERLTYDWKPDTHKHPPSGFHRDVQPKRLRICGAARWVEQEQGTEGLTHASHLSALLSIPHWGRLQRLELSKVGSKQSCLGLYLIICIAEIGVYACCTPNR
jgi:hypothetical protein